MANLERPYAALTAPKKGGKGRPVREGEAELNREEAERVAQEKRIKTRQLQNEDKVAKKVSSYYITDVSFPFLLTKAGFTMSVSQYFPEKKLAVDKFYNWGPEEMKQAELKEKLFKDTDIRYVYLHPHKDFRPEDVP